MTTAMRQRAMRELIFSVKSSTCKGKYRERKSQLEQNRSRKSTLLHQSSSSPAIVKLLFKPASRKKPEKPNRTQATMSQIRIATLLYFETHSIFLSRRRRPITLKFTSVLCYLAPPLASFPFGKPTELELYQTATVKHLQHILKHLTCIQNSTEFIQSAATSLSFELLLHVLE
ncbi:hypothetical protein LR48_Vigan11g075800 [Vigna angularis]|uniref:Uncharacterized protein n=1 Tax=Phaseolus angularis TaxID=3914 RepID=A0A0L9VRM6_PHAAN|nr:hypothetical protein LR48_Vigan11g075800 [Vigna angularis]